MNPIVGVYRAPLYGLPIEGGRFPIPNIRSWSTLAHIKSNGSQLNGLNIKIPTPDASAIGFQIGHTEIYKSNGIIFAHLAAVGMGPSFSKFGRGKRLKDVVLVTVPHIEDKNMIKIIGKLLTDPRVLVLFIFPVKPPWPPLTKFTVERFYDS